MKFTHSPSTNVAYLYLKEDIKDGECVLQQEVQLQVGGGSIILDFNTAGKLVGIEFLWTNVIPEELLK